MDQPMLLQISLYVFVFGAVIGLVLAVQAVMVDRTASRQRLVSNHSKPKKSDAIRLRQPGSTSIWDRFLETVGKSEILGRADKIGPLRRQLIAAGFLWPHAAQMFLICRIFFALTLPAAYLIFLPDVNTTSAVLKSFILLAAGLYFPKAWIMQRVARRERQITEGFPDALDLMVVCMEAGLGLDAAFTRVGQELAIAHPYLAREFGLVAIELRAGQSREETLRGLADRTGVDDLRSFVALLNQSVRLGSSIGQTLRVYSAEMREKRMMKAEEKAHRLPVLLSIPLVALILPVMVGSVLLPGIILIIRQLMPALAGDYSGG